MADRINFTNKINDSAQVGDILYYIYSTETEPSEVGSIIEVGEKHIKVETPNDLPDMTDFTLAYNLVTNGTFDISATGWSSLNAETTSTWVSSGEIQVVASGDNGGIQQEVTGLTIGEEYTFSYEVISGSGNFAHLFPGPFVIQLILIIFHFFLRLLYHFLCLKKQTILCLTLNQELKDLTRLLRYLHLTLQLKQKCLL